MTELMKLRNLVEGKRTVAIAGHVNPDGDCIGSCMALYNYLSDRYPELQIHVYLEQVPHVYEFLHRVEEAQNSLREDVLYDIFFALDSASPERIGVASSLCEMAGQVINVDHHISNPEYGHCNIVYPNASSTSEIIAQMIEADGGSFTREVAEALYLGIIQDTGVFKYPSTSAKTMEIAGRLMNTGIDFSTIVDKTFFEKTYEQAQILGEALVKSTRFADGAGILTVITREDKTRFHADDSDMDGISSQLVNTKDVLAAVFLREVEEGVYKASLRSKTDLVDVNRVASLFGGGGHKRAAGCTIRTDLQQAIVALQDEIKRQIDAESYEEAKA